MNTIKCPELCADCPLAELVPAKSRELERSGNFIAKGNISPKADRVSFDFENGQPVGEHMIEVGLVPEGGGNGVGFWVDSSLGLSGVARAIEQCKGPKQKRAGFLKLRTESVCGAVLDFAEEV